MKNIKAFKDSRVPAVAHGLPVPSAAFYMIEDQGLVKTQDGPMVLAVIKKQNDLSHMDTDIAMLLARVEIPGRATTGQEVFFWRDKTWVKGVDSMRTIYYKNKAYLLYEVQLDNFDELFENARNPLIDAMNAAPPVEAPK